MIVAKESMGLISGNDFRWMSVDVGTCDILSRSSGQPEIQFTNNKTSIKVVVLQTTVLI